MRPIQSLALLLLFVLLGCARLSASHYIGGSITYECLGSNVYRLHYHYYGDCQGIPPFTNTVMVTGLGTGCTAPTMTAWTLVSSYDATYLAPTLPTTCNSGSYPGMIYYHYVKDVDFTGVTCSDYRVEVEECCRNGMSTNISNPTAVGHTLFTDTINLALAGCNGSPVWHNPPARIALLSQANYYDMGGTDPDGDSLVYEMTTPLDQNYAPIPYNLGYSLSAPMGPNWDVTLDPETGLLGVIPSPGSLELAAIAIKVSEYRNGVRIGTVLREFEIMCLTALPANQLPTIAGPFNIVGAEVIGSTLVVPPGGSMCLDFSATDPDAGVATQLGWMSDLQGGMLTDTFGAGPDTVFAIGPWARVCWTAPSGIGADALTMTAIDTTRQLNNMVIARYDIVVGDTSLVWPGDADNDLVANAFDLLPIGVAYGSTGPVRVGASNTWVGQPSLPWTDTILGGIDKKFIDCDGSGLIDVADTIPVSLNYGLTHTKAFMPVPRGMTVDPRLQMVLPDSASVGDTISAPIVLGDGSVTASNVLGYAFQIHYDPALIDSNTFWIDFDNSWVSPSGNPLSMSRNHASLHLCDAALVRTTHTTVSGMGEVARAHFVIIDNIDGKRATLDSASLHVEFTDVRVISLNGELIPVDAAPDSMLVYDRTSMIATPKPNFTVSVYPNPAQDRLNIEVMGASLEAVELLSLQGQLLYHQGGIARERVRVDVSDLAQGMYLLRVQAQGHWEVRKITLE
jgi:hypothetical protein